MELIWTETKHVIKEGGVFYHHFYEAIHNKKDHDRMSMNIKGDGSVSFMVEDIIPDFDEEVKKTTEEITKEAKKQEKKRTWMP